jgi:hypothetical protein
MGSVRWDRPPREGWWPVDDPVLRRMLRRVRRQVALLRAARYGAVGLAGMIAGYIVGKVGG